MSEEAKWYVAHTYSGYENKVASSLRNVVENRQLQDFIKEITVPTIETKTIDQNGKEKITFEKVYPGYVIIKMIVTPESWYAVRNIRGCTGFVGTATDPIPLSDKEVEMLGVEKRTVEISYSVGDSVKIIGGSLDGYIATVADIDIEANSVKVIVSMFGRETPTDLSLNQVVPVE